MSFNLTGKSALVTGASSGIGKRMALCLAEAGASVAAAARRKDKLEETVAEIRESGGQAVAVEMDVSDIKSIRDAIMAADSELHGLHILVNNAGILLDKPALQVTPDEFDRIFATNVRGPFFAAQVFAELAMEAKRSASVINVGSVSAERPAQGLSTYSTSKAAVKHLTKNLAMEWGNKGIRVNCINPGYIHTEVNDELMRSEAGKRLAQRLLRKRIGQPSDLDGALLLFASDAGDFITGSVLIVDDGQMLSR